MSNFRRYLLPRLLIPESLGFPPVVDCFGTRPSHAARSRPLAKLSALPMAAISAGDCHAYARNRDQKPSRFVRLYEGCELLVVFLYAAVEFAPLSAHVADQFYHSWAQACPLVVVDEDRKFSL